MATTASARRDQGLRSHRRRTSELNSGCPLEYRRLPGADTSRVSVSHWNRTHRPTMRSQTHADLMRRFQPDLLRPRRELVGIDLLGPEDPEPP
jgi:hypothetical protein